ncbi:YbaB/EbfC family nucleoid-associated protein [Segniliparus rugosus]|uniref:YbaB/EbfC DNA-binding family protein n=1 Tax=Segniliparus rugosus (strain ATCC BAA-974 / DSM 45345 / CCUG 50838 / CIP 108380 / JCM 13579 / CDC 945) TaxID=679197 RepID=E5XNS8_SEGRC|nr:YbaB/EbfC family nucleoid-associated protein [Segniliparus rugosus]EFV13998.2 hypothetical protein HMPREF9336_01149 [Segniliparus rugosus ATCC BAA-974]
MSNHDPTLIARVEELRAKQRYVREALAQVRGKGYGLNVAVVVELDADGELVRCEVADTASTLNGASIASGFRRAYNEARKNVKRQVAEIMGEFETDGDVAAAIKEIQAYFGIAEESEPSKLLASESPSSTAESEDDEWEPPQTWMRKA